MGVACIMVGGGELGAKVYCGSGKSEIRAVNRMGSAISEANWTPL